MFREDKSLSKSGEYVFASTKDGIRFIGKFDDLYRDIKDPWGQAEDEYYIKRRFKLVESLRELSPSSVLDVGCGLGHATQAIKILVAKDTSGVDISKVAIKRAEKLFPDVKFSVCNVANNFPRRRFDVVILNGILWYILYELDSVLERIEKNLNPNGYLVISQPFIKDQKYGVGVIDGYEGLLKFLYKHFSIYKLVKTEYNDTGERKTDSLTILQTRRW